MFGRKIMKRILSIAVMVGFIISSFSISAYATAGQKTITATYKNSNISINGRVIAMKDAKGSALKSFSFNSQEYVPIQAIAKSLGLSVSFNTKTSTIVLKTTTSGAIQMGDKGATPGAIGMNPKNGTPGAIGMNPKNGTPGAIGIRPENGTPGAIGIRPENGTPGAIGIRPENGTPGAIGMNPKNGTPGAIGTGPEGQPPENTSTTTASVKITSSQKQLTVTYKNIKTTLNAKAITFKDAKGNTIEPFIYGGYEYVPLTSLAKALGLTATYDLKTNTYKLMSAKK